VRISVIVLDWLKDNLFSRITKMDERKFKTSVFVITAMIALAVVRVDADEKTQYKLKLEKGQKYYIKMVTEQQITQTLMGQEQAMEQTIGLGTNFDVNDVNDDDGNAWIKYTYKWAKLSYKTPMGEIEYDSSKEASSVPPEAMGVAALLDEGFMLYLTPKGEVKQVKGLDKMRSNIQNKLPEDPAREQMMKGLEQYLSDEAIKELTESSMGIYPDNPVGIGDSWNRNFSLSHGLAAIMETKWTLKGRENGVATIEVLSNIKSNPDAKPMEMGPTKISHDLSGNQKGLIKMQESTGQILHSKAEQQLSGNMKLVVSDPQPQEMIIPMTINSIITVEMSEQKQPDAEEDAK